MVKTKDLEPKILKILQDKGGTANVGIIALGLNMTPHSLHYHICNLIKSGILETVKPGIVKIKRGIKTPNREEIKFIEEGSYDYKRNSYAVRQIILDNPDLDPDQIREMIYESENFMISINDIVRIQHLYKGQEKEKKEKKEGESKDMDKIQMILELANEVSDYRIEVLIANKPK